MIPVGNYQAALPPQGYSQPAAYAAGGYTQQPPTAPMAGQNTDLQLILLILQYLINNPSSGQSGTPWQAQGQQQHFQNAGFQPQGQQHFQNAGYQPQGQQHFQNAGYQPQGQQHFQNAGYQPQGQQHFQNAGYQPQGQQHFQNAGYQPQGQPWQPQQSFSDQGANFGSDVEVITQQVRHDKTQGFIQVRDPITKQIIFRSPVVNGGSNRGMVPPGRYELTSYEPGHRFGKVFRVTGEGGRSAGQVYDRRVGDMRSGILIHRQFSNRTSGCFGVQDNEGFMRAAVWAQQRAGRRLTMTYAVNGNTGNRTYA